MKLKKKIYIIISLLLLPILYFVFIMTDFYMPKSKKLSNSKQLATEIVKEVMKEAVENDTLFLIIENFRPLSCGSEGLEKRGFIQKYHELKYRIESQYYLDKSKDFEILYKSGNKIIITGESSNGPEGCNCFGSSIVSFDSIAIKDKAVYEIKYISTSKNEVEISIIDFSKQQKIKSLEFALENGLWKVN